MGAPRVIVFPKKTLEVERPSATQGERHRTGRCLPPCSCRVQLTLPGGFAQQRAAVALWSWLIIVSYLPSFFGL